MTTSRCLWCKGRNIDMIKAEPENEFYCLDCELQYDSSDLRNHERGRFVDWGIIHEQGQ